MSSQGQVQANGQVFLLPDLGEGLVEAELVSWLVAVGDPVHIDQPIAEVETAKSVVEVPSPYEGTVTLLHGAEGDALEVGKPLITIATGETTAAAELGEDAQTGEPAKDAASELAEMAPASAGSPAAETSSDAAEPSLPAASGGSGNVLVGYGSTGPSGPGRSRPAVRQAPLVVSPLVRKLAQDHGIALPEIHGSGSDGLILRSDVEAAMAAEPLAVQEPESEPNKQQQQQPKQPQPEPVPASAPDAKLPTQPRRQAGARAGEESGVVDQRTGLPVVARTPLTGMKKVAAAALVRSRREIPDATVWVDVDATALVELRRGMKAKGAAPGLLAFVARFAVAGLGRFPELNMQLESRDGQDSLVEFAGINVGFATQTERGLVVPVLRNAQGRTARELDDAIGVLTERALAGHSGTAELAGGTFTINNYGVLGVDGSAAIINHPEAAMLGLGRIMDKPWVVDGQLCVRKMTELTLAFDHRVCDGAVAAGFLRFVADAMENPAGVLAEL
ncbi:dihydrolipoamide acetyltransferase family protein [Arthrobacter sp. H35-D1]|uniref:dihydrolipoamide acetyltransferase family protein n=1 Tax=Arthrobacter sp. H35-D1 TaxID=3046202 RepID=UPI0024B99998|nr:dihydrolipoamide acetyltransferase family protein [Arthrobacter sp. H35-D1]MDJ0312768.1 dihydrolipoamide acetyltransferase family protein [Arthrobacter sp. H35-D1]